MRFFVIIFSLILSDIYAQVVRSIEGTIIDSQTMLPLKDVEIKIKNSNFKTKTNSDGQFYFNDIEEGVYELIIFKSNFKQIKK